MPPSALQLRLEADAAYEACIQDEFRLYPRPLALYRHHFRHSPFAELYKRRRVLLRPEYWPMLHAASALRRHFHRDPMRWHARGHSVHSMLWSLVKHLYCRYPMPHFWLAEWLRDADDTSLSRLQSFALIGQGRSVYSLASQGMLGVHLSRKECHLLSSVHGVWGLGAAIRMVQVLNRGGHRGLGHALGQCAWGEWPATAEHEARRAHAIAWMCRTPGLTVGDIKLVARAVDAFPDLVVRGRSMASIKALVGEREFPRPRLVRAEVQGRHSSPPPPASWSPAVHAPMTFHRSRRQSTVIHELTSTRAIHHEGARLGHCVASYAAAAARGECSLWSLRVGGLSVLTIEVRCGAIGQVRGKLNRSPSASELKLIARWGRHNKLRLPQDC